MKQLVTSKAHADCVTPSPSPCWSSGWLSCRVPPCGATRSEQDNAGTPSEDARPSAAAPSITAGWTRPLQTNSPESVSLAFVTRSARVHEWLILLYLCSSPPADACHTVCGCSGCTSPLCWSLTCRSSEKKQNRQLMHFLCLCTDLNLGCQTLQILDSPRSESSSSFSPIYGMLYQTYMLVFLLVC